MIFIGSTLWSIWIHRNEVSLKGDHINLSGTIARRDNFLKDWMEANSFKTVWLVNGVRIAKHFISNRYNHKEAIRRNKCTHSYLEVEDFSVKITIGSMQKGNNNEWRCITDVRSPLLGITRIEGDIINIPEDDSGSIYLNNLLFDAVHAGIRIARNRKWHDIIIVTDL